MNENNLFYRLFVSFCVTVAFGLTAVMLEYAAFGYSAVNMKILWYILISGAVVSLVFEFLFVRIFPISGNNLKRNVIFRNRMIFAVVNALIVSILGKVMLGSSVSLLILILLSFVLGVIAVVIVNFIMDRIYEKNVREMNRRLSQFNSAAGKHDSEDNESR